MTREQEVERALMWINVAAYIVIGLLLWALAGVLR
jgi:hypothetical protein